MEESTDTENLGKRYENAYQKNKNAPLEIEGKKNNVDDDLYSRSIFTYGMETMQKLSAMKVLIVGMRGLGVETAKNIILSGPKEVDIFDPSLDL